MKEKLRSFLHIFSEQNNNQYVLRHRKVHVYTAYILYEQEIPDSVRKKNIVLGIFFEVISHKQVCNSSSVGVCIGVCFTERWRLIHKD